MSEIIIRHREPGDAAALQRIHAHPSVYADTLQLPYPSVTSWEEKTRQLPEGTYSLVACLDDVVVGNIVLEAFMRMRRRHCGTFGISVSHEYQNRGVGSKLMSAMLELADNWLDLTRLELTVFTDNPGAIALYRKFGFDIEGTSRRYALRHGQYVDVHHMARLREPAV